MQALASFYKLCLYLLFPPHCVGCSRWGTYLCPACYEDLHFYSLPLTLKLDPCSLDHVFAVGNYQEPLSSLIHVYKYKGVKEVGGVIARLIYHSTAVPEVEALTFVPLHPQRLAERGFNQSQLIAEELSNLMKIPCVDLLQRIRYTTTQASVKDRKERLTHLHNCFALQPDVSKPLPASVLLIDDVTTTGTTLNECARVLKAAGVKTVVGLTIAHGS